MFSDKKQVLILAALLEAHGIQHVVLCPGSRNIALVHTLSAMPSFTCHAVTDERSAAFFALGLALQSGKPAAVCCTSGTALLNFHPAVAEAFYQEVPLLILSADRPARWIGQMDGQTLPQPNVFKSLVKASINLPEVANASDEAFCNRLVNEALLALTHRAPGPVHINIPISEPFFDTPVHTLPTVPVIQRLWGVRLDNALPELAHAFERATRRLAVVGQMPFATDWHRDVRTQLSESICWVGEHLANHQAPEILLGTFDRLLAALSDEQRTTLAPNFLITFGGHIVSKALKQTLRQHPPQVHWHIDPQGRVVDLFGALTHVIEMEPTQFFSALLPHLSHSLANDYPHTWKRLAQTLPTPHVDWSAIGATGRVLGALPPDTVLHLANSSVIRYAQQFTLSSTVTVHANRGTSGIEGSLSTAVGFAAADHRLNVMMIGDLSFFYDMNALLNVPKMGINHLRIVLLNNACGEIFHALPGLNLDERGRKFIAAEHHTTAKAWANDQGFHYEAVHSYDDLEATLPDFMSLEGDQPRLIEVFTNAEKDIQVLHAMKRTDQAALRNRL